MNSDKFPLITDQLILEWINTEVVKYGTRHELIETIDDVKHWLDLMVGQKLLNQLQKETMENLYKEDLERLKFLRRHLRAGLERCADGDHLDKGWIKKLEDNITKAPLVYKVIDEQLTAVPMGSAVDCFISIISLDALQFIAEGQIKYISRCSNPECVLLFIDKTGRKKWCSMKICGNRNKVKQYNERNSK